MATTVYTQTDGMDESPAEQLFYHEAGLKATWAGARMAVGALTFLFGAFVFAYFYLRSINAHGLWHPSGAPRPPGWAGTVIMALVVLSAVTQTISLQRIKAGNKSTWQRGAATAMVLGLAAVGLQIFQLGDLKFPPGANGFDSVFTAFCPVYLTIALVVMIWLETLLVAGGRVPAAFFAAEPPTVDDTFTVQRFQARLSAFTVVWNYLAAVAIFFWVLFYLL
jgi:heme/copper-type cytochrome/quinol oxidase subunit 3